MAYENTIGILIAAKDEASAVIAKTAANTKLATAEVNKFGLSAGAAGGMLKGGLAIGLIAVAGESANLAIRFQQDMEILHTNAGVAKDSIAGLSDAFLNMASSVGQTPDELAKAFYHIASAGTGIWSTAQQLDILKYAAEGAAIGQANLGDTTYALTSAMASGVGGVKNAAEMMAVLNAVVGAGDMKLQDLNGALSTGILSTASTFGISIQSLGTALATLTDNGEHADEAATRLRMSFALMASPSSMATKQLEALGLTAENAKVSTAGMNAVFAKSGLSTTKLADDLRQPNGITVAMKDLIDHLKSAGLSASEADAMLSKAFGGGRTDAALLTMLQNVDRMDAKFKVINQNAGDFGKNYADQQTTVAQRMKDIWGGIQTVLIRVGDFLGAIAKVAMDIVAPAFKMIGDFWAKYIQPSFDRVIGNNGKQIVEFFGVLLAGAIALVVVPLLILGAILVETIVAIDKVITFVQDLARVLPDQIGKAVQGVKDRWSNLVRSTEDTFNRIIGTITSFWNGLVRSFQSGVALAIRIFLNLPTEIGFGLGFIARQLYDFAAITIPNFIVGVGNWFAKLPSLIAGALILMWQTVTGWFSRTTNDGAKSANDLVTKTTNTVQSLPGLIGAIIAQMWARAVNGFTSFVSSAVAWAQSAVASIASEFGKLPGQIGKSISDGWNGAVSGTNSLLGGVQKQINSFMGGFTKGFGAHALGTGFSSGGMALVGENGPELVGLPRGASVSSASDTRQMMGGSKGGVTIQGGLHIHNQMDEQKFLAKLGWRLAIA
jgi:TP901 family phage tail tape measure protein